jgi:hypothetical protein
MDSIVTYLVSFASELAAALPAKMSDPVGWAALVVALVVGAGTRWLGGTWALPLGWGALAVVVLTLAHTYSAPVTRADSAALAIICLVGVEAGRQFVRLWKPEIR